ncbi:MAG TPA: cysteine desulfurase family protein [Niabella sp.]|nr:cysteine desulfurase family protein [Niabella sp.]HOZ98316.1 cysteine desulfurase family protein [Niabella sp.]HQW13395.1 cysteine desulfurase family protein [Niabella sp.]HQX18789.1 cysteine desulfurase family protein [Niabella sp.]HQX42020.1 cysteine desulfurase family protein [Niabella sp.]
MLNLPIYLDYSATTPCDPEVVTEMLPYFTQYFGNASSKVHPFGWQAEAAVAQARERVATLINAQSREIVFTSGATEACNLAIRGVWELYAKKGNHFIISKTEHKAVLDTCKILEKKGACVTYLDVNSSGQIQVEDLMKAFRPDTILVCIMLANNETGVIQPVKEIGLLCKQHQVLFFCDATQAVGKIPVNVEEMEIDLICCSSHKIYGPKGVGALYIRSRNPRVKLSPQITGGGQEDGVRSGTLNVPGIVGFGKACDICGNRMKEESEKMNRMLNKLRQGILEIPGTVINGHPKDYLPSILNVSFERLNSTLLLSALKSKIAVSTGSACTSGSLEPSYVLTAMHVDRNKAKSSLRFSLGRFTTEEEIDFVIKELGHIVNQLRDG